MGCGAGTMQEPAPLGEFQSSYSEVRITDHFINIKAKRAFDKVDTVRYDNTFTNTPIKIAEVPVMLDGCRTQVYKGDDFDINVKSQISDVFAYNKICNGVELHIIFYPYGAPPSKFVISCREGERIFDIRHDNPDELLFDNFGDDEVSTVSGCMSPTMSRQVSPMSEGSSVSWDSEAGLMSPTLSRQVSSKSDDRINPVPRRRNSAPEIMMIQAEELAKELTSPKAQALRHRRQHSFSNKIE
jgi:hypothetical protein